MKLLHQASTHIACHLPLNQYTDGVGIMRVVGFRLKDRGLPKQILAERNGIEMIPVSGDFRKKLEGRNRNCQGYRWLDFLNKYR